MTTLTDQLSYIAQLVHTIISHPNAPLYKVTSQNNTTVKVMPTQLAIDIENAVEHYLHPLQEQFPIYKFNPYIAVFIKNALACNLIQAIEQRRSLNKTNNVYLTDYEYQIMSHLVSRMMDFVTCIRQDVESAGVKTMINNANRAAHKNHDGMCDYIDSLFEHYSRLLVVRIDLGYSKGNAITDYHDIEHKYRQAKHDFQRFLSNTRMNRLFEHLVGYIWSLEFGPEKGYHYHLILFFDGSQVREDVTLARMVGDYWVSITEMCGCYWNCNAHKDNYQYCGIGMIHYSNIEQVSYLKQAAAYLVKVDYYVRMLISDKGRTFGRGEILPPRTGTIGRPRSA